MAQLAIKGHATRGKEVIELLEMLGGSNPHTYSADCESLCFYIGKNTNSIYYDWVRDCYEDGNTLVFTLEEFLEKYPYKVGDKVYNIIHNENQTITNLIWDFQENKIEYQTNNNEYVYVNYLQPYKDETMKENTDMALAPDLKGEDYSGRRLCYKIPNGYEFECANKNEIILKPIKPQYPKTYEECCEVLFPDTIELGKVSAYGYKGGLLTNFGELLTCRDAYWKIAGEQMGLGKPWEQDYNDRCFIIANNDGNIHTYEYHGGNNVILAFPTAEMRDAFYENFKELIEQCKDFL